MRHAARDLALRDAAPCAAHRRRCRRPSSTETGRNAGTPSPRRERGWSTRSPSIRISPSSTGMRPSMQRSSVVLPQPEGRRWRRSRARRHRIRCRGKLRSRRSAWRGAATRMRAGAFCNDFGNSRAATLRHGTKLLLGRLGRGLDVAACPVVGAPASILPARPRSRSPAPSRRRCRRGSGGARC